MAKRLKALLITLSIFVRIPENQKYGAFHGKESFKEAIVNFYQRQYGVELHKDDEVCILYGTKMV